MASLASEMLPGFSMSGAELLAKGKERRIYFDVGGSSKGKKLAVTCSGASGIDVVFLDMKEKPMHTYRGPCGGGGPVSVPAGLSGLVTAVATPVDPSGPVIVAWASS